MHANHYHPTEQHHVDLSQYYPFPQYTQPMRPMPAYWQGAYMPQQSPFVQMPVPQMNGGPYAQQPFQQPYMMNMNNPYVTPYPKMNQGIKQQPSQMQSFMSQFKTSNGTYDMNKMMNTAGQMMGAVNQLTSLVKGFGGIFKI
ncbi:YppG family protein [Bacillus sp. CGMCC 1.16541]|uniref:YppG family protein n=1 Tax=Bacillus sp. CGMCC 1.16541 TaxID=2185143 RepID=UPI000D7358E2|nr:YppG family protein [Bacillus sp. CGMCC 1.16541]